MNPSGCPDFEVVARDSNGNVAVSMKRLGRGKVIAVNFALEKCIVEQESEVVDNSFSNELWRIYAYAAREAGARRLVTRADPRVVFTEHLSGVATTPRRRNGGASDDAGVVATSPAALVTALNTCDEPVSCPIDVRGRVGRVWNGSFADGVLSSGPNDGCVFEVLET